jgi:glycosyltransferase involved in cell wall biosynthesis
MDLTILNVAYPFARVGADPVGGAEQVLTQLDRALAQAGGLSIVIAAEGSTPAGTHLPVPQPAGEIDAPSRTFAHREVRRLITEALVQYRPHLVHFHGIDFHEYLPAAAIPMIVTLHLPLSWYAPGALQTCEGRAWLIPVSQDQVRRGPANVSLADPIENGIDVEAFGLARKQRFALLLSRICPEKGIHIALDAAKQADMPLIVAGAVFPYAEHRLYFEREVLPRLDRERRWIGPVSGARKRHVIAAARCLIVASTAEETSCLAAMEALASGTPVVALRSGALSDLIDHERTGLLVDRPEQLPEALDAVDRIAPQECRRVAESRFSLRKTLSRYLELYRRIAAGEPLSLLGARAAQ